MPRAKFRSARDEAGNPLPEHASASVQDFPELLEERERRAARGKENKEKNEQKPNGF